MKSGETITSADIDHTSPFPCHGGNGLRGFTNRFTHSGRFALIGRQGALCGNVAGVSGRFFASEHAVVVTAFPQTDVEWLTYVLGEMRLNQYSESSAQPGLSIAKLLLLDVACPPTKAEQRAIAAVLSGVDELIGSLEALVAKKRDVKQAAMQQLLAGRTRLSGFGGEWKTRRLEHLVECLDHLRVPLNETQRREMPGPYPYCGANGVVDYIADYVLDDDVILIAEDGGHFEEHADRPIAYRMKGKIWVNNHAHILKAKPGINQAFLFFALVHKNILPFLASGTRAKLNRAEMNKIVVRLPSQAAEQHGIATVLSDMDAEITALERRLDKTRAIKQGMMQQLLTGAIRLPIPDTAPHENAKP